MSLTLFKREWKASWKLLAIFLAVLSLYGGMIVSTVSYTHLDVYKRQPQEVWNGYCSWLSRPVNCALNARENPSPK